MDNGHPRRVPNPNHLSSGASSPSFGPAAASHPQYSHDPFRRPQSQHDKRDHFSPAPIWQASSQPSLPPYLEHDPKDTLHPAPPLPQSPYSRISNYRPDTSHSRRNSLVADAPSSTFHTSSTMPSAPSDSLPTDGQDASSNSTTSYVNGRHMVPSTASSPSQRSNLPPPPSTFGPREPSSSSLPLSTSAPAPSSRPNNMSISSIMDSDTPPKHQAPPWSPISGRNSAFAPHTSTASPSHVPSATTHTTRDDARPNGHSSPQYGPVFGPHQKGALPQHALQYGSPERTRNSVNNMPQPISAGFAPSPQARPLSPPHLSDYRGREYEHGSYAAPQHAPPNGAADSRLRESERSQEGPRPFVQQDRDPGPRYGPHALADEHLARPEYGLADGRHPPGPWHRNDSTELRDEDRPIQSREGPPIPEDMIYGPHLPNHYHQRPAYGPLAEQPAASSFADKQSPFAKKPGLDPSLRKSLEDSQMAHRSVLGAHESRRRMERGSPLPQAVQGASAQPAGSGRDPSIKTEFTRVFSGLGSGVGSTPVPMPPGGSPTPMRRSDEGDDRHGDEWGPRSSAKKKRPFDLDASDGESRKRRATHHHHHHPGSRPHHHHPKDDMPPNFLGRRSSATPLGLSRDQANGVQNRPHHHHIPHHHHQGQRVASNPAVTVPIRRSVTTIKTQELLNEVSKSNPRRHLGAQLYAPMVALPSSRTTPLFTKFPYALKPNLLPRSEGKENCTFTVRVPSALLTDRAREHICHQRQVWGTDVYTDDSDPLAAAMHSGWIRGAWPDDVNVDMLELNLGAPTPQQNDQAADENSRGQEKPESSLENDVLDSPPASGPMRPLANRDAHITILVLPPLQEYAASTWYGIRSRSWDDSHDGMSFKIHRVEWVKAAQSTRSGDYKSTAARSARLARRCHDSQRLRAAPPAKPKRQPAETAAAATVAAEVAAAPLTA